MAGGFSDLEPRRRAIPGGGAEGVESPVVVLAREAWNSNAASSWKRLGEWVVPWLQANGWVSPGFRGFS